MDFHSLVYTVSHYGEHELQRVGVWEFPPNTPQDDSGCWIIFIHGGAWRDPRRLHTDFIPSIRALLQSDSGTDAGPARPICAFASVDYRLSAHPDFPQNPSSVPSTALRDAQHPEHLLDVRAALAFLQRRYGFDDRYVLVGHSAGATLAFQLPMGRAALHEDPAADINEQLERPDLTSPPLALVGVSGIYSLRGLNERHGGGYASFISAAFGQDESVWDDSMPACFEGNFREVLSQSGYSEMTTRVVLAWSRGDSLIDEPEIDGMADRLVRDGVETRIVKDLTGEHDCVWEDGKQIARLVEEVLENRERV